MTTTRALAVAAYAVAVASPAAADWRSVAEQLHAIIAPVRSPNSGESTPRWWADWKLGKVYSLDSLAVRFADGVTVRCNLARAPGKLPRIAASCRVAVAFYRAQTGRDAVPAFASLKALSDGATFDPETCSRLTADLRRTGRVPTAVRAPVTPEAVAKLTAEVERRRAGLAVAQADHAALLADSEAAALPVYRDKVVTTAKAESEARVAMWQSAADAGAAELARMKGDAPTPGPVFRPRVRPLHVDDVDPAAEWCAAVAPSYGQPAAYAVGETWDPGAELPPVPAYCGADAAAQASQSSGSPVVGMQGHTPDVEIVELSGDSGELADPAFPLCSDDDDGGWQPDESSHLIIALCLSDKARAALFERIQDGTFPAADRTARGGAWRLTLADARDCAGIGSLRLIGLPRKPRVRKAPPIVAPVRRTPVAAIPVVEIRGLPSVGAFYVRPPVPGLVMLHAPAAL